MGKYKYDWPALKKEFMLGDFKTVSGFLRHKEMPLANKSAAVANSTKGWAKEKRKKRMQAVEKATNRSLKEEFGDLEEHRARQARIARWLQVKGLEELKSLDSSSVNEARKLVISGLQEERAVVAPAREEESKPTSLTQVNINLPPTRFDDMIKEMDYEQLIRFLAEIKRIRTERGLPEDIEQGQPAIQEGETV